MSETMMLFLGLMYIVIGLVLTTSLFGLWLGELEVKKSPLAVVIWPTLLLSCLIIQWEDDWKYGWGFFWENPAGVSWNPSNSFLRANWPRDLGPWV